MNFVYLKIKIHIRGSVDIYVGLSGQIKCQWLLWQCDIYKCIHALVCVLDAHASFHVSISCCTYVCQTPKKYHAHTLKHEPIPMHHNCSTFIFNFLLTQYKNVTICCCLRLYANKHNVLKPVFQLSVVFFLCSFSIQSMSVY